jgi:hypothetical protein
MRRNEYDPGMPYDPPPRRRRPLGDEYDDAWAGGDDDDIFDDGAGYSWEDPAHGARRHDLPEPEIPLSRRRYRSRRAYRPPYGRPTYHRDHARYGEYGEYYEKPKRDLSSDTGWYGTGLHIPFWQILILVILGLTAFLVTMLACVSVLTL